MAQSWDVRITVLKTLLVPEAVAVMDALVAAIVASARTVEIIPEFLYDAPEQRYCPAAVYEIVRDANGNALVRIVGGLPVDTLAYRLPEVAVGENQYIPYAPSYD